MTAIEQGKQIANNIALAGKVTFIATSAFAITGIVGSLVITAAAATICIGTPIMACAEASKKITKQFQSCKKSFSLKPKRMPCAQNSSTEDCDGLALLPQRPSSAI